MTDIEQVQTFHIYFLDSLTESLLSWILKVVDSNIFSNINRYNIS